MPYIDEQRRTTLDSAIHNMIMTIKSNLPELTVGHILPESGDMKDYYKLTNEDFLLILGDINYAVSRIIVNLMGDVTYAKIAMSTGVIENIKQELYRRIATKYEDQKILQNGDIKEYRK